MKAPASFFCFALILFLASCTDSKKNSVTLDEISHTTDKFEEVDKPEETGVIRDQKPKNAYFITAFDSLYKDASWFKLDSMLFPDRFGPSGLEKWYLLNQKDSLVALHYAFKDSLRTKNAFFNWIDCYGSKCTSYRVGSQFKKQSRSSLFLVGPNDLIYMESKFAIPANKLISLLNEKKEERNWIYVVEIPAGSKTRWSVIKEGEIKELNVR
ncbi:hypothetical protein [Fluviicola sp.]|jgi:hypothetical protein|uniref:hypothetical protein n=1 Tax=Fluviicola sp. TaxID=1917219 RepID=UPI0028187CB6|nr:hypothetical protein [Fluviicola sp.]MDR0802742.1 hypothetical protein [Fluviicola sp.]